MVRVVGLEQGENALLSRLHSKLATGLVPALPINDILMEVESVELPFARVSPLPSTAEVIVVSGGVDVLLLLLCY